MEERIVGLTENHDEMIDFFGHSLSNQTYKLIQENHESYMRLFKAEKRKQDKKKELKKEAKSQLNRFWSKYSKNHKVCKKIYLYPKSKWSSKAEIDALNSMGITKSNPSPIRYIFDQKKRPILIGSEPLRKNNEEPEEKGYPVVWIRKLDGNTNKQKYSVRFLEYKNHSFVFEWKYGSKCEQLHLKNIESLSTHLVSKWNKKDRDEFFKYETDLSKDIWKVFYQAKWVPLKDFIKEYFESTKRLSDKTIKSTLEPSKTKKKPNKPTKSNSIPSKQSESTSKTIDITSEKTKLIQILAAKIQTAAICSTEKEIQSWKNDLKKDLQF